MRRVSEPLRSGYRLYCAQWGGLLALGLSAWGCNDAASSAATDATTAATTTPDATTDGTLTEVGPDGTADPDADPDVDVIPSTPLTAVEGMLVDPTLAGSRFSAHLVILSSSHATPTGVKVHALGMDFVPRTDLATTPPDPRPLVVVDVTGLDANGETLAVVEADGQLPHEIVLSYGRHASGWTFVTLEAASFVQDFIAADGLQADVDAGKFTVFPNALTATGTITAHATATDLQAALLSDALALADEVSARVPSLDAVAKTSDGVVLPAIPVAHLGASLTQAGGAVTILPGTPFGFELTIPSVATLLFPQGSTQPLFAYDGATNTFTQEGTCVVDGATCVGMATATSVTLMLPPSEHLRFACAHAAVGARVAEGMTLVNRQVTLEVEPAQTLGGLPAEARYDVMADGRLEVTALYASFAFADEYPRFRVVSHAQIAVAGADPVDRTFRPGWRAGVTMSNDGHSLAACRATTPVALDILYNVVPDGEAPPTAAPTAYVPTPAVVAPAACTAIEMAWDQVPLSTQPGSGPTETLTSFAGGTGTTVLTAADGTSIHDALYASSLPSFVDNLGRALVPPADVYLRYFNLDLADSGVRNTSTIAGIDFGQAATTRGPDWRYYLVLTVSPTLAGTEIHSDVPLFPIAKQWMNFAGSELLPLVPPELLSPTSVRAGHNGPGTFVQTFSYVFTLPADTVTFHLESIPVPLATDDQGGQIEPRNYTIGLGMLQLATCPGDSQ